MLSAGDASRKYQVPLRTVQHAAKTNALAHQRLGRMYMFNAEDVEQWVAARERKAADRLRAAAQSEHGVAPP